jgi:hypothetical protein
LGIEDELLREVINKMMQVDPAMRPTARELLLMPYFDAVREPDVVPPPPERKLEMSPPDGDVIRQRIPPAPDLDFDVRPQIPEEETVPMPAAFRDFLGANFGVQIDSFEELFGWRHNTLLLRIGPISIPAAMLALFGIASISRDAREYFELCDAPCAVVISAGIGERLGVPDLLSLNGDSPLLPFGIRLSRSDGRDVIGAGCVRLEHAAMERAHYRNEAWAPMVAAMSDVLVAELE